MYVVNPENYPQEKIYSCNGVVANWLITEKHFPLFGKSPMGEFCFVKTDVLIEVLETLPFYLKLSKILW